MQKDMEITGIDAVFPGFVPKNAKQDKIEAAKQYNEATNRAEVLTKIGEQIGNKKERQNMLVYKEASKEDAKKIIREHNRRA